MSCVPDEGMPFVVKVEQTFPRPVCDYTRVIREKISRYGSEGVLKAGHRIAIAVGSRGIGSLPEIVKTTVEELKKIGCAPYIVPAMGSHGGATDDGQAHVLFEYGISEETMETPVISSMEVDQVGEYEGAPIYFDRFAGCCDGVIAINRVKPHTDFHGKIESGVCKMLSIGMGKHAGAVSLHALGTKEFPELIPKIAALHISRLPLVIGIPIVENAYHDVAHVDVVKGNEIFDVEEKFLELAYQLMAKLPFKEFDLLVVEEIGKDLSGAGMDPNVTGRYPFPWVQGGPFIDRVVILDITAHSDGNANGIGLADVITKRLLDKTDLEAMYINSIASKGLIACKIPYSTINDRAAISVAMECVTGKSTQEIKAVRIRNTLELTEFEASVSLMGDVQSDRIKIISEPFKWTFDQNGNLL